MCADGSRLRPYAPTSRSRYYAHSSPRFGAGKKPPRDRLHWEPLAEHLSRVARRAAEYAAVFGRAAEARAAGLLHDLGKYGDLFLKRLAGEAHGLDHWSMGAFVALWSYHLNGILVALAVQGHHVGLQQAAGQSLKEIQPSVLTTRHPLRLQLTDSEHQRLLERFRADGLELPEVEAAPFDGSAPQAASELDVRMLFSSLVDADYLETEAHFHRDAAGRRIYRPQGQDLQAVRAAALVEEHVADLAAAAVAEGRADPRVLGLRNDLFRACLEAAGAPTGTFTLSAPTGAGKTLAMLAFALRHAATHGLRRIVVAVPYVSILGQTATTFRELFDPVFGPDYILEHHSLAGTREESGEGTDKDEEERRAQRARELAENWDAPIVLTTSVQLLESLHAHRPRPCRKLHRLAGSVVLLDEVQTLPPHLAVPTLATLSHLSERYGSSVVFATATQPAFDTLDERVRPFAASGWTPREIARCDEDLFGRLQRVEVDWRVDRPISWDDLAEEIARHPRVLVVVNLKRHARELVKRLKGLPGLFHLSTNLCPLHRNRVLKQVAERLDDPAEPPCRLVSTQCIEAGVDVDFPVLYRALAPLDSIAQAAGRCNRHGKLRKGRVVVFRPDEEEKRAYPPGGYRQGAKVTETLLRQRGEEGMGLDRPELFRAYYRQLYGVTGLDTGEDEKASRLEEAVRNLDFVEVAQQYRLIDNDAVDVLVPYRPDELGELLGELEGGRFVPAGWLRKARPHAVSVYRPKFDDPLWAFLAPLVEDPEQPDARVGHVFRLLKPELYDSELLGLLEAERLWIA
jgi:CRISPR-associated endonuclease/helicase Cas3